MELVEDEGLFELGNCTMEGGGLLKNAQLGYKLWGRVNKQRNNFVILPGYYTGTHNGYSSLVGPGRALDPAKFCIVAFDLFGNGISTSPSTSQYRWNPTRLPEVSIYDNVYAQYRFLREILNMRSIALVAGWSMGGIQAYHWAAAYPDLVRRILPWCAAARCSPQNQVFLEGVKAALIADNTWNNSDFTTIPERGLRAFARTYCEWAYSPACFNEGCYRKLGYETTNDLLNAWEEEHLRWNASDLLLKIQTWQQADISIHPAYHGDFTTALRAIKARAILMPCTHDLYFTPQENAHETQLLPHAELRTVDSLYGHAAGGPGRDHHFMSELETALIDLIIDYQADE